MDVTVFKRKLKSRMCSSQRSKVPSKFVKSEVLPHFWRFSGSTSIYDMKRDLGIYSYRA